MQIKTNEKLYFRDILNDFIKNISDEKQLYSLSSDINNEIRRITDHKDISNLCGLRTINGNSLKD